MTGIRYNSNVAIEYGHAHMALGDTAILQRFPVDLNQNGFPGVGEALWH